MILVSSTLEYRSMVWNIIKLYLNEKLDNLQRRNINMFRYKIGMTNPSTVNIAHRLNNFPLSDKNVTV